MANPIEIQGVRVFLDNDGHLVKLTDWNRGIAEHLAHQEGILLNDAHWEIIDLLRQFYSDFDLSPAMRPLIKYTAKKLCQQKGNSLYLMQLFPGSPARLAAKIAGLPRPANCL